MEVAIRHYLPGRLRLHVPELCRKPTVANAALAWLQAKPGVKSARLNFACSCLVLEYERAHELELQVAEASARGERLAAESKAADEERTQLREAVQALEGHRRHAAEELREAAARTGEHEAAVRRGLERQDREHAIDISAHGARPARSPGPYRRRDVIDDRNRRRAGAHTARHAVGEIRTVDRLVALDG